MAATRTQTGFYDVSIAPEFGVVAGFFKKLSKEIEEKTETTTSSKTGSKAGQISLLRLEPEKLTHKQKIAVILKKIEDGEIFLAKGKTPTDIVTELGKDDYQGKSIKGMIAELKSHGDLLDDPKLKHPAPAFANAFKPRLPALVMG